MPSDEKNIMGYKVKFKTSYDEDSEDSEYIKLTVNVSEEIERIVKRRNY